MAADSAGSTVTTVVTCEGDLNSPSFRGEFDAVVAQLEGLLGEPLTVRKLEPWNSVRVTLSIPREAALRLRQLASDGHQRLRALGILSVQVEGDQVISLRVAAGDASEPQEVLLRTVPSQQDGTTTIAGSTSAGSLSQLLAGGEVSSPAAAPASASAVVASNSNECEVLPLPPPIVQPQPPPLQQPQQEKVQFRSPNVVCPADSIVPKVPVPSGGSATNSNASTQLVAAGVKGGGAGYPGPFPFTSMNQAMQASTNHNGPSYAVPTPPTIAASTPVVASPAPPPPPPYPGKHPPVTLSSPLLVNLLQNEGGSSSGASVTSTATTTAVSGSAVRVEKLPISVNHVQPPQQQPPPPQRAVRVNNVLSAPVASVIPNASPASNNKVTLSMSQLVQQPMTTPATVAAAVTASTTSTGQPTIARNPVPYNSYPPPYPNATTTIPPAAAAASKVVTAATAAVLTIQSQQHQQQSVAVTTVPSLNRWEQPVQSMPPQLQDLTATLTDFKQTDLDLLLPNLTASPLGIPDEIFAEQHHHHHHHPPQPRRTVLLINPVTGELESQAGDESDGEIRDVFTGLPMSPIHFSDEDTNSTIRPDTTDQSDSESRSCHSDCSKHSKSKSSRTKGRDSPPNAGAASTTAAAKAPTEKIKLRLKLEKSEPVNTVYKADVSFINTQLPKKAVSNNAVPTGLSATGATTTTATANTLLPGTTSPAQGEELRVPPLHISLRGRHVVISNKKKQKLLADGVTIVKTKPKKVLDYNNSKINKRDRSMLESTSPDDGQTTQRKLKVAKLTDERESAELIYNNHSIQFHKDKLKERRGSDSELAAAARNNKKYVETNGSGEQRRLSATDDCFDPEIVLGSTNVGTVTAINKIRNKEKFKTKDNFKNKDFMRFKSYTTSEKASKQQPQIALPTSEIDMEAMFKERLLKIEDTSPRSSGGGGGGAQSPPDAKVEELIQTLEDQPECVKDKPPEPDKCNTPDRAPTGGKDLQDKQPNRSPNSGAGQGEDSGIESMDALSEKSPNQAGQSPHAAEMIADAKTHHLNNHHHKTQVPDMLDIEAQLAKMEGMHADEAEAAGEQEDLNENHRVGEMKLDRECCVVLTNTPVVSLPSIKEEVVAAPVVAKKLAPEELEPPIQAFRVAPALYTYSNQEKHGPDSPTLSDGGGSGGGGGAGSGSTNTTRKSLLEQLLIDIPENNPTPSSPSPATRSVRTRASSKLNSPELNSPVVVSNALAHNTIANINKMHDGVRRATPTAKRKRHESDSSNNSLEASDQSLIQQQHQRVKKPRKSSENAVELIKACVDSKAMGVAISTGTGTVVANHTAAAGKKNILEESSDSDEPLIEVAGKVRKSTVGTPPVSRIVKVKNATANNNTTLAGAAVSATINATTPGAVKANVNTRRSIRTLPAINTRSKGDKSNPEGDVVRRKTRSAVSEGEGKRRKDIK